MNYVLTKSNPWPHLQGCTLQHPMHWSRRGEDFSIDSLLQQCKGRGFESHPSDCLSGFFHRAREYTVLIITHRCKGKTKNYNLTIDSRSWYKLKTELRKIPLPGKKCCWCTLGEKTTRIKTHPKLNRTEDPDLDSNHRMSFRFFEEKKTRTFSTFAQGWMPEIRNGPGKGHKQHERNKMNPKPHRRSEKPGPKWFLTWFSLAN